MKNIKFPFEIFPTDKKVLKIKEGIYWVKLLLPSMIVASARAYIALLSLMICLYEFFQVLLEDFLLE